MRPWRRSFIKRGYDVAREVLLRTCQPSFREATKDTYVLTCLRLPHVEEIEGQPLVYHDHSV